MMEGIDLEELGLTMNEAKVYKTLIEFGKLGAGEISGRSGVSYSRIYNILESLIAKGLVVVIPEKTKKFIPGDPQTLLALIEDKEKKLIQTKAKVKELKQFYTSKEKNPVIMGIGKRAFYKIADEKKKIERYGYSIRYTSEYRGDWVEHIRKNISKNIDEKFLVRYDKETRKNVQEWLKINKQIRKIRNEGVALAIVDDAEVLLSLIKSNVTLLIRDTPFARIMKKLFLAAYDRAESVTLR